MDNHKCLGHLLQTPLQVVPGLLQVHLLKVHILLVHNHHQDLHQDLHQDRHQGLHQVCHLVHNLKPEVVVPPANASLLSPT
jgi:hypothetical protein